MPQLILSGRIKTVFPTIVNTPQLTGVNHKVQVVNTRELGPSSSAAAAVPNASTAAPTQNPDQKRNAELESQNKLLKKQQDQEHCKSLQNNLANLNVGGRVNMKWMTKVNANIWMVVKLNCAAARLRKRLTNIVNKRAICSHKRLIAMRALFTTSLR